MLVPQQECDSGWRIGINGDASLRRSEEEEKEETSQGHQQAGLDGGSGSSRLSFPGAGVLVDQLRSVHGDAVPDHAGVDFHQGVEGDGQLATI